VLKPVTRRYKLVLFDPSYRENFVVHLIHFEHFLAYHPFPTTGYYRNKNRPSKSAEAVTLLTCFREILISGLGVGTGYQN
jgi:hypothetical protein